MDKSYATDGEDLIVAKYFASKGIPAQEVRYIDIGVNQPTLQNNTYYFYLQGSSGVLVEPLPLYYDAYAKERPRDIVVKGAVYWTDLKRGFVRKRGRHGGGSYVVTGTGGSDDRPGYFPCDFYRINDLLKNHFSSCPDYLSIDIEGNDLVVLKELDFDAYPIPVICGEFGREAKKTGPGGTNWIHIVTEFLAPKGYSGPIVTYNNFIYTK